MKKILLVLLLLTQMILNITHGCDIQDSSVSNNITSFSALGAIAIDNYDFNIKAEEEKSCPDSDKSESQQDHCTKCTSCSHIIVLSSNVEFDFTLLSLLSLDFNYSFAYNHQFISFEPKPPCYS